MLLADVPPVIAVDVDVDVGARAESVEVVVVVEAPSSWATCDDDSGSWECPRTDCAALRDMYKRRGLRACIEEQHTTVAAAVRRELG